jgi:aminopeptidase N
VVLPLLGERAGVRAGKHLLYLFLGLFLLRTSLPAQDSKTNTPTASAQTNLPPSDTGGPLLPEQAAYDVTHYDLALRVYPDSQSITGALTVHARITSPIAWLVLDLHTNLAVSAVQAVDSASHPRALPFERHDGRLWIAYPRTRQPGETTRVRVDYGGKPVVARNPPWSGGFTWSKTTNGEPWIGVSCQGEGADLWWPCKDHPSDEPDTMALHFTVPEALTCAANGRLLRVERNRDGTRTFHWFSSQPINNYLVTLNIAPYRTLGGDYESVTGRRIPVTFWILPQDYDKARGLFTHFLKQIRFYEERLGPYPFRRDKIGVAQTPYLGMEHQTITAYGARFKTNAYGFDWLLFHEFGHEWWGNLVTCSDWRDMWLHEGFESYMEALYAESLHGAAAYHKYVNGFRSRRANPNPVAPRESKTGHEIYSAPIYSKGALVLHTLRYLIGDKAFFIALRRMAYPDPRLERVTDGRQCHFATTDDFQHIAEDASGMKLNWFFEVYLRQAKLPKLLTTTNGSQLTLSWAAPENLPFPMPLEIQVANEKRRLDMSNGGAQWSLDSAKELRIDPQRWILKEEPPAATNAVPAKK